MVTILHSPYLRIEAEYLQKASWEIYNKNRHLGWGHVLCVGNGGTWGHTLPVAWWGRAMRQLAATPHTGWCGGRGGGGWGTQLGIPHRQERESLHSITVHVIDSLTADGGKSRRLWRHLNATHTELCMMPHTQLCMMPHTQLCRMPHTQSYAGCHTLKAMQDATHSKLCRGIHHVGCRAS